MQVTVEELRRRMTTLSNDELLAIAQNTGGIYTSNAIDAAQTELATRPPAAPTPPESLTGSAPLRRTPTRFQSIPLTLRAAFWIAVVIGSLKTIELILVVGLWLLADIRAKQMTRVIWTDAGIVIIAASIVFSIAYEYRHGRAILLMVTAGMCIYHFVVEVILMRSFFAIFDGGLILTATAFVYLIVSSAIAEYYRNLERRT